MEPGAQVGYIDVFDSEHPVLRTLAQPGPLLDSWQFIYKAAFGLQFFGDWFVWKRAWRAAGFN